MAKAISLKLDDKLFDEVSRLTKMLGTSRNRYIIDAIAAYNKKKEREELAQRFKKASDLVREDNLIILA